METAAAAPSRLDVSKGPVRSDRESAAFRWFAWSLLAIDLAILAGGLGFGLARAESSAAGAGKQIVLWFLCVLAIDVASSAAWRSLTLRVDLPILLAMGLVFGPIAAGAAALIAGADPGELRGELSVSRAVCIRAQTSLGVIVAAAVFQFAGVFPWPWPVVAFLAVAGVALDAGISGVLAAISSRLLSSPRIRRRGAPAYGARIRLRLCSMGFGLLCLPIAGMYEQFGVGSLLLFAGPIALFAELSLRGSRLERLRLAIEAKDRTIRGLSRQMAEERLDERRRIAASLHDDVIQSLHSVTLHAHVIRRDLQVGKLLQLEDDIPALVRAAQHAADRAREVIRDLRGSPIGRLGLVQTLTGLARDLATESGVRIECRFTSVRAGPTTQLLIYQVAREALINAVSHAAASRILVSLIDDGSQVLLTVIDDGAGFDSETGRPGHFGLELMRERAALTGGSMSIEASPGLGTTVRVQFKNRD